MAETHFSNYFTFDPCDGVFAVLWLLLCALALCALLDRVLVHAWVS